MRKLIVLMALLVVAGCEHGDKLVMLPEGKGSLFGIENANAIPQKCKSFGFKEGTPEYANCNMQLYTSSQQVSAIKQSADSPLPDSNNTVRCRTFGNGYNCN